MPVASRPTTQHTHNTKAGKVMNMSTSELVAAAPCAAGCTCKGTRPACSDPVSTWWALDMIGWELKADGTIGAKYQANYIEDRFM